MEWPITPEVIQSIITVALIVGILAFVAHRAGMGVHALPHARAELPRIRRDMADLYRERQLSKRLKTGLRKVRKEADVLHEHPREAEDVVLQIRRMLPAEGWLTERLAQVRSKAHRVREGHVARIEEIRDVIGKLPTEAKKQASKELAGCYKELGLDLRMERLDKAVAANEKRIRDLSARAVELTAAHDFKGLHDTLKAAEKLQKHNSQLFSLIERTEKRLLKAAQDVAKHAGEVKDA